MSHREFTRYEYPIAAGFYNFQPIMRSKDYLLTNGTIDSYANCNRNNLCLPYNVNYETTLIGGIYTKLFEMPIGGTLSSTEGVYSTVRVWLRVKRTVETHIDITVEMGGISSAVYEDFDSATYDWISFDLEKPPYIHDDYRLLKIRVFARADSNTAIDISSAHTYQLYETKTGTYTDLITAVGSSAPLVGTDDYPVDACQYKLLRDNLVFIRENRIVGSNVFNHWWLDYKKTGLAYGANKNDLGEYKFIKRAGVSKIKAVCYTFASDKAAGGGNGTYKIKSEITGTTNAIAANEDTVTVTAANKMQYKRLSDFDFTGVDITNEVECTFLLDCKELDVNSGTMYIPGVYLLEYYGSTVSHTVPDNNDVNVKRKILASTADNTKDTLAHLYNQGCKIALADWRFSAGSPYTDAFNCTDTTETKTDSGPSVSVLAHAVAYPTTNKTSIRVRLYCETSAGSTKAKWVRFEIGDSYVAGTYDCTWPPTSGAAIYHTISDGNRTGLIIEGVLPIPSAHYNDYGSGLADPGEELTPLSIFVIVITEDATEYIIPNALQITEISLGNNNFP